MVRAELDSSWIKQVAKGFADIRPLGQPIAKILLEDNAKFIGTDWNGNRLAPLMPSTLERRKGKTGPPLAPSGQASRIVTGAVTTAAGTPDYLVVEMSWPSLPWLKYHRDGTTHMKARDTEGIRPSTMDRIEDEVIEPFFGNLLNFRQGTK